MSETYFFEDLETTQPMDVRKPFFTLFDKGEPSEEDILSWLKKEFAFLQQEYRPWHEEIKTNYKRFKNIQYRDQLYQQRDLPERKNRYTPQVVAPLIPDIVAERVSRMMEFKPAVTFLPQHDESQDKTDAKIAKRFAKHLEIQERLEDKYQKLLRTAYVAGEGYLIITWNPDKGPIHPDAQKAGKAIAIGDMEFRVFSPLRFLEEITTEGEEPDYGFLIEFPYAEKLKKTYPEKAEQIEADGRVTYYDPVTMEDKSLLGRCLHVTFWHRKTPYLPEGYEAKFTMKALLKKGKLPYEHGKIPRVTLKDTENMEEQHARSFIGSIKGMVSFFNNMLNMSIKQISLMAWPKWFVEEGSVDKQQLNNDVSIVETKRGAKAPALAQGNPVGSGLMEMMKQGLEWVYSWGKSNSVMRGDPPPGITAFVALQYVSESESRRMNTDIIKFNEAVRLTNEMAIQNAGQFYHPSDKRTMLILGKDDSWTQMNYNPESLKGPFSVVIQNASSLPDGKAARTQYILDLAERFPDVFPREQVLEMTGLAQSDKFTDLGASAARAAETENELMQEGEDPGAPVEYEEHITHWRIHVKAMQDPSFKAKAPPEVQELFKDHVLATEMLMHELAMKNPTFAQQLSMLPQFPIFYEIPLPPPAPLPPPMEGEVPMEGAPMPPEGPVPIQPEMQAPPILPPEQDGAVPVAEPAVRNLDPTQLQ